MTNFNYIQNIFIMGEVDPKTKGLIGTDLIRSALSECKGFLPLPTGGIERTPGTFFSHNDFEKTDGKCILVVAKVEGQSEIYNQGEKIFGNEYYILKIYSGKTSAFLLKYDELSKQVKATLFNSFEHQNNVITVENDYEEWELDELSIAVNKGKVYIAHQNHKLEMYDLITSNQSQIIIQRYKPTFYNIDFNTINNYPSIVAFKSGRMILAATRNKPNTVWLSRTPDTFEESGLEISMIDRYFDFKLFDTITTTTTQIKGGEITETSGSKKNIVKTFITYTSGAESEFTQIEEYTVREQVIDGNKTTLTTTKTTVNKSGINEESATIDKIFQEITKDINNDGETSQSFIYNEIPAFNPPIIEVASTDENTETRKTIDNSYAIEVQESDLSGTKLKWISSVGKMAFATSNAIFITDGSVPTPATFDLTIGAYQTTGSNKVKSIRNYILFSGKDNKTLFLSFYNYQTEALSIIEISKNSRHFLKSGIRDFTIMFDPFPIVWVINGNGELCSATLNFANDNIVAGWSIQNTKDTREYLSVEIAGEYFDTLILYVKTTDNGSSIYDFETLTIKEDYEVENFIFTDRTNIFEIENFSRETLQIPTPNFNNFDVVDLILNNKYIGTFQVFNGFININEINTISGNVIARIGLTRESYIKFFDPILSENGNALLTKHSIKGLFLKVFNSGNCSLTDGKSITDVLFAKYNTTTYDTDIILETKDVKVTSPSTLSYENDRQLKLIVNLPFPFLLLAISYKYVVTEE